MYTALGKTGSAMLIYDQATLVVVTMPTEPPIINHVPGTTNQAIGVLLPHPDGYALKSLATNASVVLQQNGPLAVSQDRAYLQVGNQQVRLSDWALAEPLERGLSHFVRDALFAPGRIGVPERNHLLRHGFGNVVRLLGRR